MTRPPQAHRALEFQRLITRYGWGELWTHPGFDHRARRILVLGTMLALDRVGCGEGDLARQ